MRLHAGSAFRAQRNLVDSETGSEAWDGKILTSKDLGTARLLRRQEATSAIRTIAAGSPPRSTI
jgi:hypothetical protein